MHGCNVGPICRPFHESDAVIVADATSSLLASAVNWVADLLTGSLGSAIAVLAIAWAGFSMLQGRLAVREGGRIIIGCFILFGAPLIAQGIMTTVRGERRIEPQPVAVPPVAVPASPPQFDPYAGASVPR